MLQPTHRSILFPYTTLFRSIAGIADEGEEIIDETEENTAQRDVGLIFAGQKAEHYEIATYGGLVQLAKTLGYSDARSEEHTFELQSHSDLVCRLLLEKKKKD